MAGVCPFTWLKSFLQSTEIGKTQKICTVSHLEKPAKYPSPVDNIFFCPQKTLAVGRQGPRVCEPRYSVIYNDSRLRSLWLSPPPPAHRLGYVLHSMLLVYFLQAYALGSALKGWKLGWKACGEIVTVQWHQSFLLLIESTAQPACFPSALWGSSTPGRALWIMSAHQKIYICCFWGVVSEAGWTLHTGKSYQ